MRIEGNMDRIEFLSLLNFLSLQRRTGILIVKNEEISATLFLKDGNIIDAEYLNERGEIAFYKLISLLEMNFTFMDTPLRIERKIEISSENLILEAIKKIDEEKELFIPSLLEAI